MQELIIIGFCVYAVVAMGMMVVETDGIIPLLIGLIIVAVILFLVYLNTGELSIENFATTVCAVWGVWFLYAFITENYGNRFSAGNYDLDTIKYFLKVMAWIFGVVFGLFLLAEIAPEGSGYTQCWGRYCL